MDRLGILGERIKAAMLVRLRGSRRVTAGWMAAAVYLLCILAPGAALALGHGPAPCFSDANQPVAMMPMQEEAPGMAEMHGDGSSHDHAAMHAHHHTDASDAPPVHHHDGNTHDHMSPGPCCAMLCVSALPADLPLTVKPSRPISLCAAEIERSGAGTAPPLLYRPPIA
jgi:hypothetical protein